jgi:hypothetical protein
MLQEGDSMIKCSLCGKDINPNEFYKTVYSHNVKVTSWEKIRGVKKRDGMYRKTFKTRLAYHIHSSCMIELTGVAW